MWTWRAVFLQYETRRNWAVAGLIGIFARAEESLSGRETAQDCYGRRLHLSELRQQFRAAAQRPIRLKALLANIRLRPRAS
jgi:hypothetical protein